MRSFLRTMSFIVIFMCGVMLFVGGGIDDIKAAFSEPYDIYDEDVYAGDIKVGDFISTEIYAVLDIFAELETTTERNGSVTGREYHYYYMIPVFNEKDEDCYIAVKIHEDDSKPYDTICDNTWAWLYDEISELGEDTIKLEGVVKELEDDGYELMLEYFTEWDYGAEFLGMDDFDDIEERVLPLVIEPAKRDNLKGLVFGLLGGIVGGIIVLVLTFVVGNKKKTDPEVIQPVDTMASYAQPVDNQVFGQQAATSYDGYFEINGTKYIKSDFAIVNDYVNNGETESAINALIDRTGFTRDVAAEVINTWSNYYI